MSTFEPIEPYAVDLTDRLTRGRLLHAAARGDKRAKLTLAENRHQQSSDPAEPPQQTEPPAPLAPMHAGSVAAGRLMYGCPSGGGDAA